MAEVSESAENLSKQELEQVQIENEIKTKACVLSMEIKEKEETVIKVVDDYEAIVSLMKQSKIGNVKDCMNTPREVNKMAGGGGSEITVDQELDQVLIDNKNKSEDELVIIEKLMKQAESRNVEESQYTPKEVYLGGKPDFNMEWNAPRTKKCGCPTEPCDCKPHFLTLGDLPNLKKPVGIKGLAAKFMRKLLPQKSVRAPEPAGLLIPQLEAAMNKELAAVKELEEKGELIIDPGFCSSTCIKFLDAVKEHGNLIYKQKKLDKYLEDNVPSPEINVAPSKDNVAPPKDDVAPLNDDVVHPKDDIEPPNDDVAPLKDDAALPKDDIASPSDNVAPPKDDIAPPSDDVAPPKYDVSPPNDNVVPLNDSVEPLKDDVTPLEDNLPPVEDNVALIEDNVALPEDNGVEDHSVQDLKPEVCHESAVEIRALSTEKIDQQSLHDNENTEIVETELKQSETSNELKRNEDSMKISELPTEEIKEEPIDEDDEFKTKDDEIKEIDTTDKEENVEHNVKDNSDKQEEQQNLDGFVIKSDHGEVEERIDDKINLSGSCNKPEDVEDNVKILNSQPTSVLSAEIINHTPFGAEDNTEINKNDLSQSVNSDKSKNTADDIVDDAPPPENTEAELLDDNGETEVNEDELKQSATTNELGGHDSAAQVAAEDKSKTQNQSVTEISSVIKSNHEKLLSDEGNDEQLKKSGSNCGNGNKLENAQSHADVCELPTEETVQDFSGVNSKSEIKNNEVKQSETSGKFKDKNVFCAMSAEIKEGISCKVAEDGSLLCEMPNETLIEDYDYNDENATGGSDDGQCNIACSGNKDEVQDDGLESEPLKDAQDPQDSQEPQNPQDSKDPQDPQNPQDPQDPQDSQNSQHPEDPQDPQDPQTPQEPQNPQDSTSSIKEEVKDDKTNTEEQQPVDPDDGQCKIACDYKNDGVQTEGLEKEGQNVEENAPSSVSNELKDDIMKLDNQEGNVCHVENPCTAKEPSELKEDQRVIDKSRTNILDNMSLTIHSQVEITQDGCTHCTECTVCPDCTSNHSSSSLTKSTKDTEELTLEDDEVIMRQCDLESSKEPSRSEEEEKKAEECKCIIKECRIKLKFKEFLTSIGQRSYKKGPCGRWQHSVI